MLEEKISWTMNEHISVIQHLMAASGTQIILLCEQSLQRLQNGGKMIFMGNGGSAADSQHLAAEFVGRFVHKRKSLPAISLTTDTSVLTSIGNDFGFDQIFERQVTSLCNPNDVVVGISTSGNSVNVVRAMEAANKLGALTVAFLGQGGILASSVSIPILVPSTVTARIQEAHILIGHILCEYCDEYFAGNH